MSESDSTHRKLVWTRLVYRTDTESLKLRSVHELCFFEPRTVRTGTLNRERHGSLNRERHSSLQLGPWISSTRTVRHGLRVTAMPATSATVTNSFLLFYCSANSNGTAATASSGGNGRLLPPYNYIAISVFTSLQSLDQSLSFVSLSLSISPALAFLYLLNLNIYLLYNYYYI